jgi:dihydroorotate dehydrogenase electron transfer subunit
VSAQAHGVRPSLETVAVAANERLAEGVGSLVLDAPRCAATVQPGQFVHLRVARGADFILRRPFSVHRVNGERIEILYQTIGEGTRRMSTLDPGDVLDLIGPLGEGWRVDEGLSHALLVSGGLGAAPLGILAETLAERGVAVTVAMGAPSADRLLARELFERVSRRVLLATDDGSAGERGLVTNISGPLIESGETDAVFACGPEIMERVVARQAAAAGLRCQVSLERLMACGVGACLSCVVATADGSKRACVDGPVFEASTLLWHHDEVPLTRVSEPRLEVDS